MDPVLIAAILSLAGIVITTFGPSLVRIATAAIAGQDPVAVIAQEDVGEILHATTHLDEAMAITRGHEAAMRLKKHDENGDIGTAGMDAKQLAIVTSAIALHDLVLVGTTIWP